MCSGPQVQADSMRNREHAISADEDGNVYVAGGFNSPSLVFGLTRRRIAYGGASGFADIFVARYSSDGQALWAKKAGGEADDHGYAVIDVSRLPAGVYLLRFEDGQNVLVRRFVNI